MQEQQREQMRCATDRRQALAGKKERTHQRILEAGVIILAEEGIQGLTVERVMHRARLTVGGFYAHFKNKSQMIEEIILASISGQKSRLARDLEGRPPADVIQEVVQRYLEPVDILDPMKPLSQRPGGLSTVLSDVARGEQGLRDAVADEYSEMKQNLEDLLLAEGHPFEESAARATRLIALCVGGRALALALAGTAAGEEALEAVRSLALQVARSGLI